MNNQIACEKKQLAGMPPGEAELEQVIVTWNNTDRDHPTNDCLQDLFEAQVRRSPDLIAVTHAGEQLTYRELDARANQLAHRLQHLGVEPEVRVGICMTRSIRMLVGILGTLKAGGAYVPLDPKYPVQRLALMLKDAEVSALLTEEALLSNLPEHNAQVICLDTGCQSIAGESEEAPVRSVTPGNLAYIIYTSGSTGRPKGVAIEHRSAVGFSHWAHEIFADEEFAGTLALTSICFDLSIFELLVPLHWGGKVILIENAFDLASAPEAQQVTLINSVPSAVRELLRLGSIPSSVRTVNLAGEALENKLVQQLYDKPHVRRVYNLYGPTEDTTYSTSALMKRASDETPSIGRPVHNTRVYLLDGNGQPVQVGAAGELHLGGAGLSRGYWRQPELTAGKFIPDPFSPSPGGRLYCTGDLARYRKDGEIEYLGRLDQQVKIRGFRIELGEVEWALAEHPGVRYAIVLAREDQPGDRHLVAYVVATEARPGPTANELRLFLKRSLPAHMVPSAFVTLDEMPLTPNGKIDRVALLLAETVPAEIEEPYVAPRTPVEAKLASIWAEVMGLVRVGVDDNFFELGGHSLLATRVISQAREVFQVEVPMRAFFELATVSRMAKSISDRIEDNRNLVPESFPPLVPVSRDGNLPLSFSQERVWFIEQLYGVNLAYQFQSTLRFKGALDIAALELSLSEIIRRHEVYRTTFPIADGRPVQLIHRAFPVSLPLRDLSGLAEPLREAEAQRQAVKEFQRTFDIDQLPLVRWTLFRFSEEDHLLLHVEHHLVHDGWSFNRFLKELTELYGAFSLGKPSPLAEPSLQFVDFACWQRQLMQGELANKQIAYWTRKLERCPRLLEMPIDRARPAVQSLIGSSKRVELPPGLSQSLRALSRRQGGTLFMTMVGGFLTMLHRYTGQTDICIGSGVANRRWRESEQLLGMIVNLVALRADLSGNPSFQEFLTRVRGMTLEAYENQDLPFDQVVEAMHIERNLSYAPVYQVLFSFHDSPMPDLKLPNLEVNLQEALSNGSAKYDLNVICIPRREQRLGKGNDTEGVTLIWEYNTDLFDETTITRMIGHYLLMLAGIVADPEQQLSAVSLLAESEREQILVKWNDTARDYPSAACIQDLFEKQVERAPESVAVVFEDDELTYEELNVRANQLAHYLRRQGVGPDVRVGIMLERSLEMVVGLLGILKAGGSYVPLDPSSPRERLAFMVADAGLAIVLTSSESARNSAPHEVRLDTEWKKIAHESKANPTSGAVAENLAYVTYTSGSTGTPKGVEINHRAVIRLVCGAEYIDFNANNVFLQSAPISFDASTFEIWGSLLHGAKCVLLPQAIPTPEELCYTIRKHQVNILWLTTSLFNHVMNELPETLSGVGQVLTGGEIMSMVHVQKALRLFPSTQIINCYGPTESTTFTSSHKLHHHLDPFCDSIPIGRPIANTEMYIVDQYLQPVPVGIYGELLIGGLGLARGYLNQPELTAEKFIPHPFSRVGGARLYRTGDLVRYLASGEIEFSGRRDQQVKIRGFRIELGEVEAALCTHAGVRQAVVVARVDERGEKRLVAYVIEAEEVSGGELRAHLKERLPDYMLPTAYVTVSEMPLTPNGKVDRERLPAPEGLGDGESGEYEAPQTAIEEVLAGIWAEVLGIERVSRRDNFFDIGGHSLLATRVISWVRKVFKVELGLRTLFEEPTVAGLAAALEAEAGGDERLQRTAELLLSLAEPEIAAGVSGD